VQPAAAADSAIYQFGGGDAGAVFDTLEQAEAAVRASGSDAEFATAALSFPIFHQIGGEDSPEWHFNLQLDYRPYGGLGSSPPAIPSGSSTSGGGTPSFKRIFNGGGGGGPPPQVPNCGPGGPDGGSGEGDPCIAASGNQSLSEYDFTYGAISFSRYYNSLRMLRPYAAINPNWSHSFAQRVLTTTLVPGHGTAAGPEAPFIVVQDAQTHAEFYRKVTAGTATVPGVFRSTVQRGRVMTVRTVSPEVYEFVIHHPDGRREYYDNAGTVTRIHYPEDKHRSLVFTSTVQPSTLLPLISKVTDGDGMGRSIKFLYGLLPDDPYWHLIDIQGVRQDWNPPYEGLLHLAYDVEHGYHQQNLLSVQRQGPLASTTGGKIRQYRYGESTSVALPLHLTSIIDENDQNYATFTYDYHGRALSSVIGGIAQTTEVDYAPNTGDQQVSATRALGGQVTYGFQPNMAAGGTPADRTFRKPTTLTYAATDAGPAYSENWVYGYQDSACSTADERLCRYVDQHGVVTEYQYDALFERVRIEGKGTTEARRIETDYAPNVYRPSERRVYAGEVHSAANLKARTAYVYDSASAAITARCEYDVADSVAMSYACSATTVPPAVTQGVRRSVYTYCVGPSTAPGDVGCPAAGWLSSVTDPEGGVTSRLYYTWTREDACNSDAFIGPCRYRGDLARVTNPLGHVTDYLRYDWAGHLYAVKEDNDARRRTFIHTPEGWLKEQTIGGYGVPGPGAKTTFTHDDVGNVTGITDPDGVSITYEYDSAYRLTDIVDELGNRMHFVLDSAGNRVGESTYDPTNTLKRTLSRQYDELGRLSSITDALSQATTTAYDGENRAFSTHDPLGREARMNYDGLGRLRSAIQNYSLSAPSGSVNVTTTYAHDVRDNLVQVIDPEQLATTYTYDGLGNLRSLHSPDTGTTLSEYDRSGNRIETTDARNVTATYGYDDLSRLIGIDYPTAGLDVTFHYDQPLAVTGCPFTPLPPSTGRLTQMLDSTGTTTYCHDARGNVVSKKQVTGALTFNVAYGYTLAGRSSTVTYPNGAILTQGYDTAGRVTSLTYKANATATPQTVVSGVSWYPFGPSRQITYGDGHTLARVYDQNYAIDSITSSLATGLKADYGIDAVGNVGTITGRVNNEPISEDGVKYDALNRVGLYTSKWTGVPEVTTYDSYGYTGTGDRVLYEHWASNATRPQTVAYTYQPGSHRLGNVSSGTNAGNRSYNNAGATTSIGAKIFTYDDRNRLVKAKPLGQDFTVYKINGKGERVQKLDLAAGVVSFVYDESGKLLGEYNGSGVAIQEYVYLGDMLVATLKGGVIRYVETDHLGTPRVVIDPVRHVAVWTWSPFGDPFGVDEADTDPDGDGQMYSLPLRFPGQYYDVETGLHYNNFRDYDTSTGRYIESDPVGLIGGASTYTYALASPLRFRDAMGLFVCWTTEDCACLKDPANCPKPLPAPKPTPPKPIPDVPVPPAFPDPEEPDSNCGRKCPECVPPAGTICWQLNIGHDHKGVGDPHYHTYRMNQDRNCNCNWNKRRAKQHTFSTAPGGMLPCSSYPSFY
jgi:RHS repeat-associated protein